MLLFFTIFIEIYMEFLVDQAGSEPAVTKWGK